ncbi:helix-turn-helix transcriptional regulator [Algoriphagus halophilus]|uniref:Helix-turn-helix domain-containing protein n=1 Tax=Algoriphagus halophilus TaxID=226505 RepID=A0A1N6D983_9BACT|nr:helix-turn-helix transcriptional regulator [Algoriphagus halophilus]SIN67348.1 Helix-turn-helix domain-containing protein [Algoriphagus halophilus]
MNEKIHHGRNIKRFREMMGIKQEALAHELGDDWSQKKISLLEQKEEVEDDLLRQVAAILKVPAEAIKSFNEETAINFFNSSFNGQFSGVNYHTTFNVNPIEKWVEALEENKKLYERLLEAEREKVEILKKVLEK